MLDGVRGLRVSSAGPRPFGVLTQPSSRQALSRSARLSIPSVRWILADLLRREARDTEHFQDARWRFGAQCFKFRCRPSRV